MSSGFQQHGNERDKRRWDTDDTGIFFLRQPSYRGQPQPTWQRQRKNSVMHWNPLPGPARPPDSTEYPSTMKDRIRMENVNGREAEMMYSGRMTYKRHTRLSTHGRDRMEQSETYWLDRNEHDIVKKLADQAATLRKLRLICIILAVLFVLISVAFGLTTSILMRKTNTLEQEITSMLEQNLEMVNKDIGYQNLTIIALQDNMNLQNVKVFEIVSKLEETETKLILEERLISNVTSRTSDLEVSRQTIYSDIQSQSFKIQTLETEANTTQDVLSDQSSRLAEIQNSSITKFQTQASRIEALEIETNTTRAALSDYSLELAQMQNSNITKLELDLESIYEVVGKQNETIIILQENIYLQNDTLYEYEASLQEVKTKLILEELQSLNNTLRIQDLETDQQTLSSEIYLQDSRIQSLETEMNTTKEMLLDHTTTLDQLQNSSFANLNLDQEQDSRIQSLELEANITRQTLQDYSTKLNATDYQSAFTAHLPQAGPEAETIKFINATTNIGGHYNTDTGKFTCQYPGTYVFSLHLCKDGGESWVRCYIRLNGFDRAVAYTDTGTNHAAPQLMASTTVVLQLANNDVVDLGQCSGYGSMDQDIRSSFSGYLLQAD